MCNSPSETLAIIQALQVPLTVAAIPLGIGIGWLIGRWVDWRIDRQEGRP